MPRVRPRFAKLTRPRLHDAVPRERLFALLDGARDRPLTWVSGPPGAGKTTLVASWLEARGFEGIWYQVDGEDRDPATVFHYLGLAALPFGKRRGKPLPAYLPEYTGDLAAFTRRFLRQLFECLPDRAVLVFDNAQNVPADAPLHRILIDAVDEAHGDITLCVISHSDPVSEFARLEANGAMRKVGSSALELTRAEAEAIAARRQRPNAVSVALLHERSGGWLAGFMVLLDALGDEGAADPESAARRVLFDYFATQAYRRLPHATQQVLLASAVLGEIDPAVMEALEPGSGARRVFEDLHRHHQFVERLGAPSPRYRLHPLFREFLRERLTTQSDPAQLRVLQERAGRVLEDHGDLHEAFELYANAEAWEAAARVLVATAPSMLGRGRWQAFDAALARLPEGIAAQSASLAFLQGVSRLGLDPTAAERHFQRSYTLAETAGDVIAQLAAAGAACSAIFFAAEHFDRLDAWLDAMTPLLQPDRCPALVGDTALYVHTGAIVAMTRRPRHPLAAYCVGTLTGLIVEPLDVNLRISAAAPLMLFHCYTGDIHAARRLEVAVEPLLAAPDLAPLNEAFWYAYLGYVSVVENTPERGHAALERAEAIAEREGFGFVQTVSYSLRSALLRVGDESESWLAKVEPSMRSARPYDLAHFLGNRLYRAVMRGQWAPAVEYGLQTVEYTKMTGSVFQQIIWEQPLAWSLAEAGRFEEARQHLDAVAKLVEFTGAACYRPLVLLTEARMADLCGDRHAYIRHLREAFAAARTHYGAQRLLFWMPQIAAPKVCADALEQGIDPPLARMLIREYPLDPPIPAPAAWPWSAEVRTLGTFEVRVLGQAVTFTHKVPRKPLALLKAIVALGSTDVPRERVLDALWPDEEGDAAVRSLDVALHRLRRILGDADAIVVESNAISLDPRRVRTDVQTFLELLNDVRDAATHNDRPRELDLAARALHVFSGGFLPADAGEPWTVSLRERLRAGFVELVEGVASRREADGEWAEAARWYQRGLDLEPLGESFYQGLMRCHLGLGRHVDGLAVYQRMREQLSAVWGVAPSARSEALHRELKAAAPSIR